MTEASDAPQPAFLRSRGQPVLPAPPPGQAARPPNGAGPRPEGSDMASSWASFICQGGVPARQRLARVWAPEPGRPGGRGGSHAAGILRSLSLESRECGPWSSPDGLDPGLHHAGILVYDSASKG